jgi:serine/threonine protein kinase
MIACIAELHSQEVFHRDIKPQNFLCDGDSLVVSDFGLGMEPNSTSRFTSSSMFWGTQGYLPPEFQRGGFKHADASGDIFMLGKTIYVLLTRQNPTYLVDEDLPAPLFHVIERSCDLDKKRRYQTLSALKQALGLAFDVMLNRGGWIGEVNQLIATIKDRLINEGKYKSSEVIEFLEKLSLLEHEDQVRICLDLDKRIFVILTHEKLRGHVDDFLKIYKEMVESENYGWTFAETIANNMEKFFKEKEIPPRTRGKALELAIEAAIRMNRFAAMDTCNAMITSVDNDDMGVHIAAIIQDKPDSFLSGIEPSQCKCDSIRAAIRAIKE